MAVIRYDREQREAIVSSELEAAQNRLQALRIPIFHGGFQVGSKPIGRELEAIVNLLLAIDRNQAANGGLTTEQWDMLDDSTACVSQLSESVHQLEKKLQDTVENLEFGYVPDEDEE